MSIVVQKYGGSSVADPDKIQNVAQRIAKSHDKGHQVVVVISAMGDTTDDLIALAHKITDQPESREMDVLLSTGEKLIRRRGDAMIAVADLAFRDPEGVKRLLVGAFREKISGARVALPADKRDGGNLGWSGPMVSMAVIAHRGVPKAQFYQELGVHAVL